MFDINVLIEKANLLLRQERYKDAEKQIKQALELEPENDYVLSLLSRCYLNDKKYDKGIEVIHRAISLNPENGYYHYLLGFGHYQNELYSQAITHLYKAISLDQQAEFYGLLAFVYLAEKNFEVALVKANEGLEIDAENIMCLNARSTALNKLRRTDDAIETMRDTLSKDPDNEFTHTTIGWNYLEKGIHKEAAHHFREALRIDPDHQNAKSGLKEALKSKIPPYRWLLQFGFWFNKKSKNFRWAFFIIIIVGVRLISGLSKENKSFETIGMAVAGLYFLFVAMSWIINPFANVFLLFHKMGKHALEKSEKWNAIAFLICIFSGTIILVLSSFYNDNTHSGYLMGAGLITLSLCIPTGHMSYPIRFNHNLFSQWLSIGMILMAICSVITALIGSSVAIGFFVAYFLLLVVYTWANKF